MRALLAGAKLLPEHKTYFEACVSLSCAEFFTKYFSDEGDCGFEKFIGWKGEQNIVTGTWQEPTEEEQTKLTNCAAPVQKVKRVSADFVIKNNPFVKKAPTVKSMFLLERSDTKLVIRSLNKTSDVPYCDVFTVEEEWVVQSLPSTKCCAVRVSMAILWHKSSMMSGMIQKSTISESQKSWDAFRQWLFEVNKHQFREQKPPQKKSSTQLKHKVEHVDQRKIHKKKKEDAPPQLAVPPAAREKRPAGDTWQEWALNRALDLAEDVHREATTNPIRFLLCLILLWLWWQNRKLSRIERALNN